MIQQEMEETAVCTVVPLGLALSEAEEKKGGRYVSTKTHSMAR
jgi:hypothetical protein